jgi:hypothetical protein
VDWWDNSEKEFNKILDLLKKPVLRPAPLPEKTALLSKNASKDDAAYKMPQEKLANLHKDSNTLPAPEQLYENYQAASLPAVSFTPEEYLLPRNAGAIKKAIQAVLKTEAPISESLLTRRVVQSFGISRAGSRIQQRTAEILQSIPLTCTRQADQNFYWTASQNPDTYPGFRTSVSGVRDAGDIPVQELANAVCGILKKQIAMPKDELVRETANLLGYSRLGTNVISAINTGIEYAVKKGRITEQTNDYFVL